MSGIVCSLVAVIVLAIAAPAGLAQEHRDADRNNAHEDARQRSGEHHEQSGQDQNVHQHSAPGVLALLPGDSVTEQSIDLPSGKVAYTATAGTFALFDQSGERSAQIFYTAFVAKSANATARPVTFVFNGGPGAASAFLNPGVVGPRIAQFGPDGRDGSKVRLIDNPDTWLAFTDLVLIDPVGTGWSRAAKPDGARGFWSVHSDAQSMAKVIAVYVAKNGRASSPKFILGESYGGFRAAKVARVLQSEQGIVASGVLLLSPTLEGAFQFGGDRFALRAPFQLLSPPAAPRQRAAAKSFYARVAKMTGLPVEAIAQSNGFIQDAYVKSLEAGSHKIVSHYDATFASDDPYPTSPVPRGPDPILDTLVRAYGGAFVGYARDELGFKADMSYNLLAGDIAGKWDWEQGHGQPSVNDDLRVLLALTPSFRLLIAHGYSDMVTPYAVSRYVLDHLPPFEGRATLKLYRGGHMFYLDPNSRKAFSADARAVYQAP